VLPLLSHGEGDDRLVATVTGRESFTCTAAQQDGPEERPCRRFSIVTRRLGKLVVRLTWDDSHPLMLALTTSDGLVMGTACCRSPQRLILAVKAASAYELQVMLVTTWGRDEIQRFELTTSLEES
jgi:hypothetical protein